MLFLIVSDKQLFRRTHTKGVVSSLPESEIIIYDDTYGKVADLEQYLYPSLFSLASPVIHLKFMLAQEAESVTTIFLKKLLASPTIFLFEELALSPAIIALFKKTGAVVHVETKAPTLKKEGDIFLVTKALTNPDKKSRWIAYRTALVDHPVEAIIGILYWKVRELATKNAVDKEKYLALYKKLLTAHARAWETGAPLELMIEKVLLTQ
jgi:hypothetical protein